MSVVIALAALTLPLAAQGAPDSAAVGHEVKVGDVVVVRLDQAPRAVLHEEETLWLRPAGGELQRWDRAAGAGYARVARQQRPDATGLFLAGGRPWIQVHEVKAVPLTAGGAPPPALVSPAGGQAAQETPEPTEPAPIAEGQVLRAGLGTAVVDLGSQAGIKPGTQLRFLGTELVEIPDIDGEGTELREVERVTASGQVRVVEDDRALVDLARGGRVDAGDRVELREGRSNYPVAPERLGGLRESGLVVRPVLALETLGVAFINELWTTWAFEQPWYATARVAPLGAGWSKDGNPLSIAGLVSGGYDARYFSVGLGAGWSMLNGDPSGWGRSYDQAAESGFGEAVQFDDVDGAFSIVQEARLGARDGLNLVVRNTFVLVPQQDYIWNDECEDYWYYYDDEEYSWDDCYNLRDQGSQFEFGGIAMALYVPVGSRTDLFTDWGTGGAGATWVEAGVSSWLRGNGDKGSLGLSVAPGYGQLDAEPNNDWVSLYGPLVSVGVRWRW